MGDITIYNNLIHPSKGHQMKKIKAVLLLIASISIILCVFISGCTDDTYNFSNDSVVIEGKEDIYSTITDAINNAIDGDTILVGAGLYNESLIITKSITLVGDGKDTTIISGNLTGDVIHISISHVTITGFTIQNAGNQSSPGIDAGIDIRSSYNTISNNNIISNGLYGIHLYIASKNNTVTHNTISDNNYGICLENASKNDISSNTVTSSTLYGVYLKSRSNNNLITNNVVTDNDLGARIKSSSGNTVTANLFANNQRGLYFCCGAIGNIAFSNSFINNSQWNASDNLNNQWDNGTYGNYWGDYNGPDTNGDGIGDAPYYISEGKSVDRYPLMEPPAI